MHVIKATQDCVKINQWDVLLLRQISPPVLSHIKQVDEFKRGQSDNPIF